MSNEEQANLINKLVDDAVTRLIEHVDSVQIFVTYRDEGGGVTSHLAAGAGNFYARKGFVDSWLRRERQFERHAAEKEAERGDDEDLPFS